MCILHGSYVVRNVLWLVLAQIKRHLWTGDFGERGLWYLQKTTVRYGPRLCENSCLW